MRNALIDVGSNTIRFVAYDGTHEIENYADYAGLIAEVSEGEISPIGIAKIIKALTMMKSKAEKLSCENIYAFATASLRDIKDKEGLISLVENACGITIEIITGEAEARYDYAGLKMVNNLKKGVAFDLGGGSCQIMLFENDTVSEAVSLPVGSLRIHGDFVSGVLPEMNEREQISEHVRKSLHAIPGFEACGYNEVYAMGGAVFALTALSKKYWNNNDELTLSDLEKICELTEEEIIDVVPQRLRTVIPAALTMIEFLKYSCAEKIIATNAGVRDGILFEKFLVKSEQ